MTLLRYYHCAELFRRFVSALPKIAGNGEREAQEEERCGELLV